MALEDEENEDDEDEERAATAEEDEAWMPLSMVPEGHQAPPPDESRWSLKERRLYVNKQNIR
jgi:hypothetical protein